MDHSHMSHGDMGHDMPMPAMCSMNMLFTWDTENLCIVFRSWRVTSTLSLVFSLLAIIALTAGYELVREAARRYEKVRAGREEGLPPPSTYQDPAFFATPNTNYSSASEERSSLLPPPGRPSNPSNPDYNHPLTRRQQQRGKIIKAFLYAVQVFYSFFIMLLFMTYNGWVMLAVGVGAFVGYLVFADEATGAAKSAACH